MFEEYLTNYCWKRDQSNTLPIDRKESKAIPTIITPISSQNHGCSSRYRANQPTTQAIVSLGDKPLIQTGIC
ncbi:hypothetical protein [Yersinia hibernica]|uniref:Transposase n=2 Tax=Yersinia TaxID=629 RepID=A0ABX5QVI2_9GAMM|nr:hypothetical protein LC20_08975 [Yersinia hibernica]OVZ94616.1 hypothetical protein CBW54_00825 [Yersinia kristensenii]QAX77273.1 hypothetical protein D5F51_01010 [Yersinia hibernica]